MEGVMTRLEVLLPVKRRAALDRLAAETGLTSSGLAKVAIAQLLARPDALLPRDERESAGGA
jgi:hypothetical protein